MGGKKDLLRLLNGQNQNSFISGRKRFWHQDWIKLFLFYTTFSFIFFLVPESGSTMIEGLLSIATFAFAILLGFSLSRRYIRFSEIKGALRLNDAKFFEIYQHSKLFSKKVSTIALSKIEECLINQIDYKLIDFAYTLPKLISLREYVFHAFKPKTYRQEQAYYHILDASKILLESNKKIEHNIQDNMPKHEWIVLGVLSTIIWVALLLLGHDHVVALIIIPLLATSFFYILLILQKVDLLRWNEHEWIWNPLSGLFRSMGLDPYFPVEVFVGKRVPFSYLKTLSAYRVAVHKYPYPNMDEKKVFRFENT